MPGSETIIPSPVTRDMIADYINLGTTLEPKWVLMGTGFNTLDENANAQTTDKTYINQKSASAFVKSYQAEFPYDTDLIVSEEATMKLYSIGRNRLTGADAIVEYCRVELFDQKKSPEPTANTFAARKFMMSVVPAGNAGPGGDNVVSTGTLKPVGDFVDGWFNTSTKTFEPKEA